MKKMQISKRSASEVLRFSFPPQATGRKILKWYQKHHVNHPWRKLWAEYSDPWHVWVSEIMLQQTVIKAALPVYDRFLKKYPTIKKLALASEEEVRLTVRGLGYYRRFGLLHKAAQKIVDNKLKYPTTFEGWKELPGVGDYTASAISSICFDQPVAVVDGNVERVICRLLDWQVAPNDPKLKALFREYANELLPISKSTFFSPGDFNQGIMELGQTVCIGKPLCNICPLRKDCLSNKNNTQHLAPAPKIKKEKVALTLRLGVYEKAGKVALYQRPDSAKFLKNTWGFITEIKSNGRFQHDGGIKINQLVDQEVGKIRHNITNHNLTVQVRRTRYSACKKLLIKWVKISEVDEQLVSNLDRKAWKLDLKNR
jgi:A/G-specific adenine glycosylase